MRIIKGIKVVGFVFLFIVINLLLSYLLVKANGPSEVMWKDFRKTEKIDTVYLGSSFSQMTFNPYIIDEATGWSSFNMGTPGQPLDQTKEALTAAIQEKKIKRAVLVFGIPSLELIQNANARATFARARKYGCSPLEKLRLNWKFVTDSENFNTEASLTYFFPWTYNSVDWKLKTISENLKIKRESKDANASSKKVAGYMEYVGKGYAYAGGVFDYNTAAVNNTKKAYSGKSSDKAYEELEEMCKLCQENSVDFMVVNTPKAPYDIAAYGAEEYFAINQKISGICSKYGADYYDFNLVKPELFAICPEYLSNFEHLNKTGSEVFCKAFSKFVLSRDAGEDVSQYFYDEDTYMESVKDIVATYLPGYDTANTNNQN